MQLGNWAVIDLETTGVNPANDAIIDVGYLQFENAKLVKKFNSLVHWEHKLPPFIKKLTGISQEMVRRVPSFQKVLPDILELSNHELIAHNSDFEESFLAEHLGKNVRYQDSLLFLGLLFPYVGQYKLESFIVNWQLAKNESHRGFEDSLHLLQVMIVASLLTRRDSALAGQFSLVAKRYRLDGWWFFRFWSQPIEDLLSIASSIEFDAEAAVLLAKEYLKKFWTNEELQNKSAEKMIWSQEFSGENIKKILSDTENVKKIWPNYVFRQGQLDLSLRVGQSLKNNIHSLVQAPTGTGKTMGYLLPAALFALEKREPVLIATGTKALQAQAMQKDVPKLWELLAAMGIAPSSLKVVQLIGSQNHFCELLFSQTTQELAAPNLLNPNDDFADNFSYSLFEMIFWYNQTLAPSAKIMRTQFPQVLLNKIKKLKELEHDFKVDFRACIGSRCPLVKNCTYMTGLREAREAQLIIGNHALMFQWPGREGRPQAIIVDEAHRLEHEATSAFTVEVNQSELLQMTKAMGQLQGIGALFYLLAQSENEKGDSNETINHIRSETLKTATQLKDYFDVLISRIEILMKNRPRYQSLYWNEIPWWKADQPPGEIEKSIYKHFEYTYMALLQYYELLLPYSVRFEPANLSDDQMMMAYGRFESFFSQVSDIVDNLKICLTSPDDYSMVLRFHEKEGFSLEAGPVNIGKIVHEKLLATTQAVVMTSATLANMQGTIGVQGMEWVTGHSYLVPEKRFKKPLFIPPIYDYGNKAKVFLCDDVPFHQDREYVPTIMKKLIPMVEALEGKSLFLFSSRERFERAREILLDKLDGIIPVFVQGMGISVVEEFKRTGSGVLLGMELFGEGIDIPGEALRFVFIDKVPDLRMEKVITDRREFFDRSFGNEFSEYYLAARARSLQQKLGRLLRTESDFGGALIADPRIKSWKGRTSEKWNELMLPYKIERQDLQTACDEIVKFIKKD